MSAFRLVLASSITWAFAVPADAQSMHGKAKHSAAEAGTPTCTAEHAKMGHCTPAVEPAGHNQHSQHAGHGAKPAAQANEEIAAQPDIDPDCPPEHAQMGHCTPKTMAGSTAMDADGAEGTDLQPGNKPAPPPPSDWYADRLHPKDEMDRSRAEMMKESGGTTVSFLSFDLAEYVARKNGDGYRWEGEGWFGGDINRLTLKYEGEGEFGGHLEDLELSGLYSRAVSPYWNLQLGVRHDVKPDPSRTHAVVGIEGLAPYWFEVSAAAFLSNKGEVRARIDGYYDLRVTQKLVLQPRLEANFSAQSIPELGIGAGLSDLELGARLRYEIVKEFAPYIGFEWTRQVGETARFARASGERVSDPHFVAGIRFWF
jgi:copper resistance protein B